jgi:carboxyl-terminal processing protease
LAGHAGGRTAGQVDGRTAGQAGGRSHAARRLASGAQIALWTAIVATSGCGGGDETRGGAAGAVDAGAGQGPDGAAGGTAGDAPAGADAPRGEVDLEAELRLSTRTFPLLVWSAYAVSTDYVDASRFDAQRQLAFAFEALSMTVPEFTAAIASGAATVDVRGVTKTFAMEGVKTIRDAADVLEQVLDHTQAVLALEPEPLHELEYAAINGLLSPLDPHTILLTPEETSDLGVKTRGAFGGIGVEVVLAARRPLVTRVLPAAPAERAGVQVGDIVMAIDRRPTLDLGIDDVQRLMRGEVATKVVLTVKRDGKSLDVEITRATIRIPSVEAIRLDGEVGLVRLTTFQEDSAESFAKALEGFAAERPLAALVIDLRGNSGGLLQQATKILDLFVDEGELVIVRSSYGREQEVATPGKALADNVPIVALVDEDSASAAEIVAGSLQALGRGVVVGRSSFGKGSVQMLRDAAPYGRPLALKLTVAEYRVAGDRRIQTRGVVPELELLPVLLAHFQGVAQYYDRERFDRRRERARILHLPSAAHENLAGMDATPTRALAFLDQPLPPPGAPGADGAKAVELAAALAARSPWASDPEVDLARQVALALAAASERAAWPATLDTFARDASVREEARLVDSLVRSGVAWSAVAPTGDVTLDVRLEVAQGPVTAGEPFTLRVDVTNRGAAPVERVHLMTDCPQDELDGIEVLVGRIDAGATVSRTLDLQFLPWHRDLHERLSVDVHVDDVGAQPDAHADLILDVRGQPRPHYAFDWWLTDDPALAKRAPARPKGPDGKTSAFAVTGNGNGVLEPGEHAYLSLRVFNEGVGSGNATRVVIDNTTAAQALLEEGLIELGPMKPGASREGTIALTVSADAVATLPVELSIMVGDGVTRESTRTKLRLPVAAETSAFSPSKGTAKVVADRARLYTGASSAMPVIADAPAGTTLEVVGTAGPWLGVRGPQGQRAFVDASLVETGAKGSAPLTSRSHLVQTPTLELTQPGPETTATSVKIAGIARHPTRVRDVVVHVAPSDPAVRPRKVAYVPNPTAQGADASALPFTVEVPLEPGSNRVIVLARDGDKVEAVEEVWVYRAG